MPQTGVIVFGGYVQGLSYTRCLGKRGIPVAVLDNYAPSLASKSKFCRYFSRYPDPVENEEEFIRFMLSLGKKLKGWVLIPTHDEELVALSKHSNILKRYFKLTFPGWSITSNIVDKSKFYRKISGVATLPKTIIPKNVEDAKQAKNSLNYPVFVRPSIGHLFYRATNVKGLIAHSPKELVETYLKVSRIDPQPILQEYIEGPPTNLYSLFSIIDPDGKVCAAFTARKIGQIPLDLGTASVAETIAVSSVQEIGLRVLRALKFFGISQVEFKYDSRDRKFKVIEVNGRGFKWIEITTVFEDFPWMLYKVFSGMQSSEVGVYNQPKSHIRWIHLADVIRNIIRKEAKLSQVFSWIFSGGKKTWACASVTDGLPFITQLVYMARASMRKQKIVVTV